MATHRTPPPRSDEPSTEAIPVQHPAPLPRTRRRLVLTLVAALVTVVAVAAAVLVVLANRSMTLAQGPAVATGVQPTTTDLAPSASPADTEITVPSLAGLTGGQASSALAAAGVLNVSFSPIDTPLTSPVTMQNPPAGTRQRAGAAVSVTLEPPPPVPHSQISARDWQVIAKNPDAHTGKRIIVYGYVTQFDAATGTTSFRASIDGVKHRQTYEYDTNTFLRGTADALADIVVDDEFKAEVTVGGSLSYDTQIGGSTTVPVLQVDTITRL